MHLLYVEDFLKREPGKRAEILALEIQERERELLLCSSVHGLISVQILSSLRVALGAGLSIFLLVWSLSQLAQLGQSILHFQAMPFGLPTNVGSFLFSSSTRLLPSDGATSAFINLFHALKWQDAATIGFVASLILLIEKAAVGFFTYRRSRALKSDVHVLEKEIETLKKWRREKGE